MLEKIAAVAGIVSAVLFILIEWPRIAPALRSLLVNAFALTLGCMWLVGGGAMIHGMVTFDLKTIRSGLVLAALASCGTFAWSKAWNYVGRSVAVLVVGYWLLSRFIS